MKTFVLLFSMILSSVQAQASSKFAGDYYTILRSYFSPTGGGKLAGAIDITVANDGSVSGRGVYVDRTPVSVRGMVEDSGKIVLYEGSNKFVGYFNSGGKQFYIVYPENTVTGDKLARKFPEAGVYHAKTASKERMILFVDRDHSVHGIFYGADGVSIEIEGKANTGGFSAESSNGGTFVGEFDGTAISGTFTTPAGDSGSFSGAKY